MITHAFSRSEEGARNTRLRVNVLTTHQGRKNYVPSDTFATDTPRTAPLKLASVLALGAAPTAFKLHLACWNGRDQPLDVFVRSETDWDGWNAWRGSRDDFSRPHILSFMDFYHEPDIWLFGGIYDVVERGAPQYTIHRQAPSEPLIGRLKVRLKRPGRAKAFLLERYVDEIEVVELLRDRYTGRRFPGYEHISHPFHELEAIIRNDRPDWRTALENVKGVYLVVDDSNGKRYVGSAYGDAGIWSRWRCYINTGHGWNDELTALIDKHGLDYARRHFRFVLLEYRPMKVDDHSIIEREVFWKESLLSRIPFGYNRN